MSSKKRMKDEPAATSPAVDDTILLDGVTNGTRALAASYFDSFAKSATVKPLVAGAGVTLTDNGTTITIDSTGFGGGYADGYADGYAEGYTGGANTVVGVSSDDLTGVGVGTITAVSTGWGWRGDGSSAVYDPRQGYDDFTGIPTGTITSVTTGSNWAGAGTGTIY